MDIRAMEFAHDLKMPIQLIYSCVQLLEMELQSGSRAEGYLKMLMQSANQLQSMVTNALDDRRLPGDHVQLHMQKKDIVAQVRDLCRQTALFADEKRIRIAFSSNASSFYMKTDSEKIDRILGNLLSNALRFTPENGSVSVLVQILGDSVEISVSDTGCGIAEGEPVFDRGYTKGGNGYGLAIVKEYASRLGGWVRLSQNESGGCCFMVHLPAQN